MPMMVASTGSFSVSGVRRALEPCTISTISPWPAPTVSTQTKVRPVPMSRDLIGRIDAQRLDGQQFSADHANDLLRRNHAAGDFGDEHDGLSSRTCGVRSTSPRGVGKVRVKNSFVCRATINSSLVGMIHICTRLVALWMRFLTLGLVHCGADRGECRTSRGTRTRRIGHRAEFSPMPPVKTMASAPFKSSRYAPR